MGRSSEITLESECTATERAAMTAVLQDAGYTGAHLEIGTAAGGTLKELMGTYPDPATRPPFFVIDPLTYFADQLSKVKTNLSSAGIDPDSVTFWIATTQSELPRVRASGQMFDFVFIDGDHRHYPVMVDLQWADLVTVGGTVCLHDNGPQFPGVGWSIDYFLDRNPNFERIGQADTLTLLRKTAEGRKPALSASDLRAAKWAQWKFKTKRSLRRRLGLPPASV